MAPAAQSQQITAAPIATATGEQVAHPVPAATGDTCSPVARALF